MQKEPFRRDFDLISQIKRSSGSAMDNIAEGFERGGTSEFIHFLTISRGSVAEVKSQLYRASDYKYLDKTTFDKMYAYADEISKMISGLIEYLKKTQIKGNKFKDR